MKPRTTMLLVLVNVALAMVVAVLFVHFDAARSNAQRDQGDASIVLADLEDIAATRRPVEDGQPNQQVTAGLHAAAVDAGIAQQLQSVEVSASRDSGEPPTLAIRLGAVTLAQLQSFLKQLQASPQPLVSANIHLSVPQGPDAISAPAGEAWTAEVALRSAIGGGPR